ncbi:F0F1 ATP synthase subunit gamma [Candidatus Saccharibacteria bacterium]|nr:MAG: F0F1 ATP synthase subunit gamma [Candidatus Saccharibacteria bacterium]
MSTLVELTSVFEGIASMRIAQTKNQVLQSTKFFDELWKIYTQLRVDSLFSFGREENDKNKVILDKELYIIITAEGGFSGDIDQKLVQAMLDSYDKDKNDIIVIGHHGAMQLSQRGYRFANTINSRAKTKTSMLRQSSGRFRSIRSAVFSTSSTFRS